MYRLFLSLNIQCLTKLKYELTHTDLCHVWTSRTYIMYEPLDLVLHAPVLELDPTKFVRRHHTLLFGRDLGVAGVLGQPVFRQRAAPGLLRPEQLGVLLFLVVPTGDRILYNVQVICKWLPYKLYVVLREEAIVYQAIPYRKSLAKTHQTNCLTYFQADNTKSYLPKYIL